MVNKLIKNTVFLTEYLFVCFLKSHCRYTVRYTVGTNKCNCLLLV